MTLKVCHRASRPEEQREKGKTQEPVHEWGDHGRRDSGRTGGQRRRRQETQSNAAEGEKWRLLSATSPGRLPRRAG